MCYRGVEVLNLCEFGLPVLSPREGSVGREVTGAWTSPEACSMQPLVHSCLGPETCFWSTLGTSGHPDHISWNKTWKNL